MRTSLAWLFALSVLGAGAAWAGTWSEPGQVLGLPWGAPVEAAREQYAGGQLGQEAPFIATYSTATHLEGIPLSASFQFVPEHGLQGVILRFPVHRLAEMVALFERHYGLAPIRGNEQWRWEGRAVRITLGGYPNFRTGGQRGIAWLRTSVLEGAIARGEEAARSGRGAGLEEARAPLSQTPYDERVVRRIYWALKYPATTYGVYRVSLAFRLTPAGRATALELHVDPPNPEVTESVRAAVRRAQPFPLPPSSGEDQRVALDLTVTVMP